MSWTGKPADGSDPSGDRRGPPAVRPARGRVDLWSMLIAAAAVGMWFLLPASRPAGPPRTLPAPRVAYVGTNETGRTFHLNPPLFVLPSPVGFGPDNRKAEMPRVFVPPPLRPMHILPRPVSPATTAVDTAVLIGPLEGGTGKQIPVPPPEPAFRVASGPARRLVATVSGALERCGFEVPPPTDKDLEVLDRPWMVTVAVDVGARGGVEHVLIEKGCDDQAVHDMVLRLVHRGRASQPPGEGCSGWVTVNFGGR